jgi:hypothetical protein
MAVKIIRTEASRKPPFQRRFTITGDVASSLVAAVVGIVITGLFFWMIAGAYPLGAIILAIVATAILGPSTIYSTHAVRAPSERGKRKAVVVSLVVTEVGALILCGWAAHSIPTARWISGISTWAPVGGILGLIWGFRCWSWTRMATKYFDK